MEAVGVCEKGASEEVGSGNDGEVQHEVANGNAGSRVGRRVGLENAIG